MVFLPERIKSVVSVVDLKMAWMMSPTAELSLWLNFGCSGLVGGALSGGDDTNKESWKRAKCRSYCWTIQYDEFVIACRRECCFFQCRIIDDLLTGED